MFGYFFDFMIFLSIALIAAAIFAGGLSLSVKLLLFGLIAVAIALAMFAIDNV